MASVSSCSKSSHRRGEKSIKHDKTRQTQSILPLNSEISADTTTYPKFAHVSSTVHITSNYTTERQLFSSSASNKTSAYVEAYDTKNSSYRYSNPQYASTVPSPTSDSHTSPFTSPSHVELSYPTYDTTFTLSGVSSQFPSSHEHYLAPTFAPHSFSTTTPECPYHTPILENPTLQHPGTDLMIRYLNGLPSEQYALYQVAHNEALSTEKGCTCSQFGHGFLSV